MGEVDGVAGAEGAFLACSFWLVDALTLIGREGDARALFEHLLTLRNDVGLLAEEYDTNLERLVGNFPQALSHLGPINSALLLSKGEGSLRPDMDIMQNIWTNQSNDKGAWPSGLSL